MGITTEEIHQAPITFIAALDENFSANGKLFYDDGVQIETKEYIYMKIQVKNNTLTTTLIRSSSKIYAEKNLFIEKIELWGVQSCKVHPSKTGSINTTTTIHVDCFTAKEGFKKMILYLPKEQYSLN